MDVPWENLGKHFGSCNRFIKGAIESGGKVFVHCYAGVSRSAAIGIAYIMQEMDYNLFQAMSMVKAKRPCIFPNPGF